jgi:hypothetical protein
MRAIIEESPLNTSSGPKTYKRNVPIMCSSSSLVCELFRRGPSGLNADLKYGGHCPPYPA